MNFISQKHLYDAEEKFKGIGFCSSKHIFFLIFLNDYKKYPEI